MANITLPPAQPPFDGAQQKYVKELASTVKELIKDRDGLESAVRRATSVAQGASDTAGGTKQETVRIEEEAIKAPAAPGNVSVSSEAYWDERGAPKARIIVTWDQVMEYYTGEPLAANSTVTLYQVWAYPSNSAKVTLLGSITPYNDVDPDADPSVPVEPPQMTLTVENLEHDTEYEIGIRARSLQGAWGDYSDNITFTTAQMAEPPLAPSAPIATSRVGVVSLEWDGNLIDGGVTVESDNTISYVYVLISDTETGTYTVTGNALSHPDTTGITSLDVGSTHWFKFGAVNKAGVAGPLSTPSSVTVEGVDLLDLNESVQDAIDEALETGQSAQATADGKNTIFTSFDEPFGVITLHKNVITNPSFEVSLAGWESEGLGLPTPTRDTARAWQGVASAKSIATSGIVGWIFGYPGYSTANISWADDRPLPVQLSLYGDSAISWSIVTQGFDAAGTLIAQKIVGVVPPANEWYDFDADMTITNTTGTPIASIALIVQGGAEAGASAWLDRVSLGSAVYIDGDMPGESDGTTYHWLGESGLSPSIASNGELAQGDLWWQLGEQDGGSIGIVNVKIWNGSAWSSYLLVADEILVPGSVGNVVIRDGAVSAEKLLANSVTAAKIEAGAIDVQHLSAGLGDRLDITGNVIAITAGRFDEISSDIDAVDDNLNLMQMTYTFGPDGAVITQPGSIASLALRNDRIEILQDQEVISYWDAAGMHVDSFEGTKVILARHMLEEGPVGVGGTVVKLVTN